MKYLLLFLPFWVNAQGVSSNMANSFSTDRIALSDTLTISHHENISVSESQICIGLNCQEILIREESKHITFIITPDYDISLIKKHNTWDSLALFPIGGRLPLFYYSTNSRKVTSL